MDVLILGRHRSAQKEIELAINKTRANQRRASFVSWKSLRQFSPQTTTAGSLVQGLGIVVVIAAYIWFRSPMIGTSILLGLVCGLALGAKSTWLVVVPLYLSLVFMIRIDRQRPMVWHWMIVAVSIVTAVNAAYGFPSWKNLGEIEFISERVRPGAVSGGANCFSDTWAGNIPCPLPAKYLQGIDIQKRDFERGYRSYLMGEWKDGGWWYYYLVGFLVKEPIGFQLLLSASIVHGVWNWRRWTRDNVREWSLIVLPPVLILGLVSSQTGFNHHMRYALPAYPFLFIIAARVATLGRFWKWFTYAMLTWQVAAVLWFAPHWMSYFNEAAGGPKNGHEWLVDSNIDWGQDILMLKWWQDRHPEVHDLHAALFTMFDPIDIGLTYQLPPPYLAGEPDVVDRAGRRGPQPGWHAVSVNMLKGLHFSVPEGDGRWSSSGSRFTYFMEHFEPVDMIGYSIYIYHITETQAAEVRAKLDHQESHRKTGLNQ